MKLVVFGLTLSSSWGNGHATLWRGLCRALAHRGHRVVFFEKDVPYYAFHRDLRELPGTELVLYAEWSDAVRRAKREVADADAAMVTSYCPDGVAASELALSGATSVFYDLDTPITLEKLEAGAQYPADFPWGPNVWFVRHLPPAGHPAFYGSSPLTLNVTRAAMARMGWCPSGRLFEAAACGTACLSDAWDGLADFFEPGREILLAETAEESIAALTLPKEQIARIGRAARERALAEHTAGHRATQLLDLLGSRGAARETAA